MAGSFWTEIANCFAQDKSEEDVLDAIQASWPASSGPGLIAPLGARYVEGARAAPSSSTKGR